MARPACFYREDTNIKTISTYDDNYEEGIKEIIKLTKFSNKQRLQRAYELIILGFYEDATWELYEVERRSRKLKIKRELIDLYKQVGAYNRSSYVAQVYFSGRRINSGINNLIPRPLIATRVLTALDNIIVQLLKDDKTKSSVSICADNPKLTGSSSIDFDITEEEASELAIVHDETLSNPANEEIKEESLENSSSVIPLITSQSTGSNYPTALVVDDSPSVRKQLELELDLFKVDVDYAGTAEEALSLLNNKKYDIAFLDVVLPDKDGFQICKHIKSESKDTIVMMLTGKATQSDKIKGSLAGCDDYLVKPVGRNTFQNATGKYLSLKARESYAGI